MEDKVYRNLQAVHRYCNHYSSHVHPAVQTTLHHHNVTFKEPFLNCLWLFIESTLLRWCVAIMKILKLDRNLTINMIRKPIPELEKAGSLLRSVRTFHKKIFNRF